MVNTVASTTSTSSSSSTTTSSSSSSSSSSTLNQDDFMQLLIAQMKYQDPLNPTDSTQYMSQLAQFSSLQQLENLNDKMTTSINANYTLTQSINNTMAASFIGKDVKLTGSSITYDGSDAVTLGYTLPAEANKVTVKVYNSSGALVKTLTATDMAKGDNTISWDGTNNQGNALASGTYTFSVDATASNGSTITPTLFKYGQITAVKYTDSGTVLVINGADYSLSDVTEIVNHKGTGN
jgi:flagellar basal-body rod modification protein FlgD